MRAPNSGRISHNGWTFASAESQATFSAVAAVAVERRKGHYDSMNSAAEYCLPR